MREYNHHRYNSAGPYLIICQCFVNTKIMNFLIKVTNVYILLPSSPILHPGISARFKPPLINILELERSQATEKHPPCNSFPSFRWLFLWPLFLAELQQISSVSVDCLAAVGCFHRRGNNAGELPTSCQWTCCANIQNIILSKIKCCVLLFGTRLWCVHVVSMTGKALQGFVKGGGKVCWSNESYFW